MQRLSYPSRSSIVSILTTIQRNDHSMKRLFDGAGFDETGFDEMKMTKIEYLGWGPGDFL